MLKIRRLLRRTMVSPAAVMAGLALLPTPALAQYIGGGAPLLPAQPPPGGINTPANALTFALRTLAQSPRDFNALITAGRAALELGDRQAAIGFFGRAEEVRPSDPAPKIGMGAATVLTGDASAALRWFFEAQRLGGTSTALGADRGLAQDLLGNQASAQIDYRAALGGREAMEARRRLALSLGISGNRTEAFAVLQPLLLRRDPAAQRIRAFVLALVGDERGASSAIDQAMPGTGSRMAGFFRLLPTLSAPQKAAAVHLGVFPNPSEIRVAGLSPQIVAAPPARVGARPAPAPRPAPTVVEPAPAPAFVPTPRILVAEPVPRALRPVAQYSPPAAAPVVSPPLAVSTSTQATSTSVSIASPGPALTVSEAPAPPATGPLPASAPLLVDPPVAVESVSTPTSEPPPIVALSGDRLSGIDRLLAQADELPVPPAPQPRFEKPKLAAVDTDSMKKAADLEQAAEAKKTEANKAEAKKAEARKAEARKAEARKAAQARRAADAKKAADAKAEREALGLAGTNWVQLAGGSQADRMGLEFRRLAAKSAPLKKRGGAVTAGKDYFRLLTGPFASKSEAQAFVNQLAKDGVDGFSWTRTPAALKIEKLPPK